MLKFLTNTASAIGREVRYMIHHPMAYMLMLILPLFSFALFALLLESGVAHNIPIAVVDEDNSPLSRKVIDMIGQTPTAMVSYQVAEMIEAERLMREGKIMAIVQVPSNFEKNILKNSQANIKSYISGTNITVNGLLSKDIKMAVATFNAGIQIQLLTKKGLTQREAMAQVMPVKFDKHILFNPYVNYSYYLLPSFLPLMLMIFTLLATIYSIGSELRNSTSEEWLKSANGSMVAALLGKLLPIFAVMFTMSLVMLIIIFGAVGVPLNGSLGMLIVSNAIFILSYQSIGVFFIALLSNLRLAISLGGGYAVLAFSFSGLTFPIMAMLKPMKVASHAFPFTYYTDIFVDQGLRGAPMLTSMPYLCYMSLFIILSIISLPRLHKVCTDSKFWGRL